MTVVGENASHRHSIECRHRESWPETPHLKSNPGYGERIGWTFTIFQLICIQDIVSFNPTTYPVCMPVLETYAVAHCR